MLKIAGVSASGAALVAVLGRSRGASKRAQTAAPAKSPSGAGEEKGSGFLSDLTGRQLGRYCVQSVGSVERGGVPVILATAAGETFRVDVLRADPFGKGGIGVPSKVAVYLRNGGNGATATDEERGLGAMALAAELARRGKKGEQPPAALLTMDERTALDAVT